MQKKKLLLRKTFFQKETFYTENVCVTNKNIYLFELYNDSAKKILIIKNIFIKTSWQTL